MGCDCTKTPLLFTCFQSFTVEVSTLCCVAPRGLNEEYDVRQFLYWISCRPYCVRQILTFHTLAGSPLYVGAAPSANAIHGSFSVHSLTIYHCTSHVYMLDVCAVLYCVYAAGYLLYTYVLETHIYTLFLSASCLQAALDLGGTKSVDFLYL